MDKEIIRLTPDQLGYKDRGKMKWMGLMLSDHTEALNNMAQKEQEKETKPKPKQTLTEIGEKLAEAYQTKQPLAIQANIIKNGSYFKDVHCLVSGQYEEKIFLMLKNGQMVDTTLEDIRHIEFLDSDIWYQKK